MDSIVQDTSGKVIEHLFLLVEQCGQLALASEVCPTKSLKEQDLHDLISLEDHISNDVTQIKVSVVHWSFPVMLAIL